jgi:antitoxin component YwqK of YwqJK toxin-antitoxin module
MNHAAIVSSLAFGAVIGCGVGNALIDKPKKTYLDQTKCDCDSIRTEYYSEGNVWSETPYRNGVVHGMKKVYYMNGQTLREVEYQNNTENGTLTDYTPNGEVLIKVSIRNGVIQGISE